MLISVVVRNKQNLILFIIPGVDLTCNAPPQPGVVSPASGGGGHACFENQTVRNMISPHKTILSIQRCLLELKYEQHFP